MDCHQQAGQSIRRSVGKLVDGRSGGDILRIVCGQISRIIQSVIGKVPWKHFPDGKQVQLPITTS